MLKNFTFPSSFFVTGTDTNIGKTFVSAILAHALGYSYWKPVQTGDETDRQWLEKHAGLPSERLHPETYHLKAPLSPHAAAELEGMHIDLDRFHLPVKERLVVEGAGGVLVPLNSRELVIDLIKKLRLPVIVVARSGLGTLNHTLLTIEKLRSYDIPILGVILNGMKNPKNAETIELFGKVPVLAQFEPILHINKESLLEAFNRS